MAYLSVKCKVLGLIPGKPPSPPRRKKTTQTTYQGPDGKPGASLTPGTTNPCSLVHLNFLWELSCPSVGVRWVDQPTNNNGLGLVSQSDPRVPRPLVCPNDAQPKERDRGDPQTRLSSGGTSSFIILLFFYSQFYYRAVHRIGAHSSLLALRLRQALPEPRTYTQVQTEPIPLETETRHQSDTPGGRGTSGHTCS